MINKKHQMVVRFISKNNLNLRASLVLLLTLFLTGLITPSYAVNVGDSFGGGTVFCVSQTPDIATCVPYGEGNYGLIVSNEDLANFDSNPKHGVTWASSNNKVLAALSDDDGSANTAAIIAVHPNDNPSNNAAWLCRNYKDKVEGHEDWYLPAKNELNKLYIYASDHYLIGRGCLGNVPGGIQCLIGGREEKLSLYWSSTEYAGRFGLGHNYAWFQGMGGAQSHFGKVKGFFGVRAIRAFISPSNEESNSVQKPKGPQGVALGVTAGDMLRGTPLVICWQGTAPARTAPVAAAAAAARAPVGTDVNRFTIVGIGDRFARIGNLTQLYPPNYQPPTLVQAITDAGIQAPAEVAQHCEDVAACAVTKGAVNGTRLTQEDVEAIALYTYDFGGNNRVNNPYRIINTALFERNTLQLRKLKGLLYKLLQALRSVPPVQYQTLYRGITEHVKLNATHYHQGNKITWHTFSSTTVDMQTTQNFLTDPATGRCEGTLFIIRGTPWGYNIQPFSCFPDEREILMEPEIDFMVTGVLKAPLIVVELEMLPDQRLLLESLIPRNIGVMESESVQGVIAVAPAQYKRYIALADWETTKEGHLSFKKGEIINIIDDTDSWWLGELNGQRGWVPPNYLRPYSSSLAPAPQTH